MNLPNFLIIGAPRSGTDFLSYALKQHPNISFALNREIHFFDRNYEKGLEWYQQYFLQCENELIGEKTANYLISSESCENIYEFSPDVKLIISLRNPIHRVFSHYTNWIGKGAINSEITFKECINKHPEIINIGYYTAYIQKFLKRFPKRNIHILFFENLIENPQKELDAILIFLGAKEPFQFSIRKKNESYPLIKYRFIPRMLGQIMYKHFFSKIKTVFFKLIYHKNRTISKEDYEYLKEIYTNENEKLFELLNIKQNWND